MRKFRLLEVDRKYHPDVAVAWAHDENEIRHYAGIYAQDGSVRVEENIRGKWTTRMEIMRRENLNEKAKSSA